MKSLFLFVCLILPILGIAQTNVVWETNAVGQVVDVSRFDRFQHNGAYYAWVEVPASMLAIEAPAGAKWSGVFDESGTNVVRQKTMAEFMMPPTYSVNSNYCLAVIAAMERPTMRTKATTRVDMAQWEAFVSPYGLAVKNWLDLEQYRVRLAHPLYGGEQ